MQSVRIIQFDFSVPDGTTETHHIELPPLINSRWQLDSGEFTPASDCTAGAETEDGAGAGSETLLTLTTASTFELVTDPRTDLVRFVRLILNANAGDPTQFRFIVSGIFLPYTVT